MKYLIAFSFLFCASFSGTAQHSVEGKIVSICKGHTQAVLLAPVTVFSSSHKKQLVTNLDGEFHLDSISGIDSISVRATGYQFFKSHLPITRKPNGVLIILSEGAACDFDNELVPKKAPKFKGYQVLKNAVRTD